MSRVFAMDPESLVEALRGTMDPNLREAAERQLNEVKVELGVNSDGGCGAALRRASAVHNIKMERSRRLGCATAAGTDRGLNFVTQIAVILGTARPLSHQLR